MIGRTNVGGGGSGNAFAYIKVEYPVGSTVRCSDGNKTLTAKGTDGTFIFAVPYATTWTITATRGSETATRTAVVGNMYDMVTVTLAFSYTVTFMNGSEFLEAVTVEYDETATFSGVNPTKASDQQYVYTFAGWNSQDEQSEAETGVLEHITANKTVYATFSHTLQQYTVTFMNNTTVLGTNTVNYGSNASDSGITAPTRASTAAYDYNFVGWNSQNGQSSAESGVLNYITANKTVYAAFSQTWNGVIYAYGVSYNGFSNSWTKSGGNGTGTNTTANGLLLSTAATQYTSNTVNNYTSDGTFNLNNYNKITITYSIGVNDSGYPAEATVAIVVGGTIKQRLVKSDSGIGLTTATFNIDSTAKGNANFRIAIRQNTGVRSIQLTRIRVHN